MLSRASSMFSRTSSSEALEQMWTGDGEHCSHWHPLFVPAPVPENDATRLKVLWEQKILDTPDEEQFDSLVRLAKRAFNADMALISLVDEKRAWFKARDGYSAREIHRDLAFCSHTILQEGPETFVVTDATDDDRFRFNQLTVGPEGIRFYAGAPLLVHRGDGSQYKLGCLCVCGTEPREEFTATDCAYLAVLAAAVVREMELRPRGRIESGEGARERVVILESFFARSEIDVEPGLIEIIAQRTVPRVVQSEHFVTRRGDPGDSMFFLSNGSCSCIFNGKEIERLKAGSCFGELSIMNMCKMRVAQVSEHTIQKRCVRSADIRALERCELLQFYMHEAWPLLHQHPVFWKLLEAIADTRQQRIANQPKDDDTEPGDNLKPKTLTPKPGAGLISGTRAAPSTPNPQLDGSPRSGAFSRTTSMNHSTSPSCGARGPSPMDLSPAADANADASAAGPGPGRAGSSQLEAVAPAKEQGQLETAQLEPGPGPVAAANAAAGEAQATAERESEAEVNERAT